MPPSSSTSPATPPPIGLDHGHDHRQCIEAGIDAAEQHCAATGLRLTPVRRRVLALLLAQHRAMGAYELLDVLRQEGLGSQPPVIYRALNFLVKHGLAHRIEHLNAFVACATPNSGHAPVFLICRMCKRVGEVDTAAAENILAPVTQIAGFRIERASVEAIGICAHCEEADHP